MALQADGNHCQHSGQVDGHSLTEKVIYLLAEVMKITFLSRICSDDLPYFCINKVWSPDFHAR